MVIVQENKPMVEIETLVNESIEAEDPSVKDEESSTSPNWKISIENNTGSSFCAKRHIIQHNNCNQETQNSDARSNPKPEQERVDMF